MYRFFVLIALFFFTGSIIAAPNPPSPKKIPPPPPGLPIDENIYFLILIALIFSFYSILKYQIKTKASI
ncbi:hypothetical protein [Flavobacterium eburneipallidum]|uniref:hypothetical protein n=1 Tax=Flavobacterium eburneipallidum TaxID=3003263 RepID=UPI002482CBA8|nr:hypothetical protein [Flavobacterium eburneipallidum]